MDLLTELAVVTLRTGLAALAVAAAVHKLRDLPRSRRATQALLGVGHVTGGVALALAAGLELAGAAWSLTGALAGRGPLLLAVVWLAYAAALGRKQRAEDCGCGFGSRSPSHAYGLVRNLLLAAAAVACAGAGVGPSTLATVMAAAPAALVLLLLYLAADELGAHPRLARSRP